MRKGWLRSSLFFTFPHIIEAALLRQPPFFAIGLLHSFPISVASRRIAHIPPQPSMHQQPEAPKPAAQWFIPDFALGI